MKKKKKKEEKIEKSRLSFVKYLIYGVLKNKIVFRN